ncbi:MAG: hypothetical protein AAGC79_12335 [Pseudomonadota bacterium]
MPSLGFSDLTDDEALLISLFRDWIRALGAKATFERLISARLAHDPISEMLPKAFEAFRRIAVEDADLLGIGDQLSQHEEYLLDALSETPPPSQSQRSQCPTEAPILRIRSTGEIAGSGFDALTQKLNHASWAVAFSLADARPPRKHATFNDCSATLHPSDRAEGIDQIGSWK